MNTRLTRVVWLILISQMFCIESLFAKNRPDSILQRVFDYPQTICTEDFTDSVSYAYSKFSLNIKRRNIMLMTVPTMYAVAHGGSRRYIGESYNRVRFMPSGNYEISKLLSLSTVPHRHTALPTLMHYLTPRVYDVTMIKESILSPFNRQNKRFYKYATEREADGSVVLQFKPKLRNTLLVDGWAVIDAATGRIVQFTLKGEYDMIQFRLFVKMGEDSRKSLLPQTCHLDSRFTFLGNDIRAHYSMAYHLPKVLNDSIVDEHDLDLMERVRPEPLSSYEKMVYNRIIGEREARNVNAADSATANGIGQRLKAIVWDMIGENILTHISQDFGPDGQGYFRINPVLNPLYMEYNPQQGVLYKFDVRGGYKFTDNSDVWLRFKSGYAFKIDQFFFELPIVYYFDKRHNGYIESLLSHGRRMRNSRIVDELKSATNNNSIWDGMHLDEFKDMYWDCNANYDISNRISLQAGFILHRRSAVHSSGFEIINRPSVYFSLAPKLQVRYRPWGYQGPIFMASYEQSMKNFVETNMPYTRWEFDGQYILPLGSLQSMSMRIGTGFYTHKDRNGYFVDFDNFRQTFIPNGWNDPWSGEFELLNSGLYNISNYYFRSNFTYESPFFFLAWTPFLGHFIERERFYLSLLTVKDAHPYIELGYAVKTRFLSIGAFTSSINGRYESFGIKFGVELFSQW